jgi:hypothetical protein
LPFDELDDEDELEDDELELLLDDEPEDDDELDELDELPNKLWTAMSRFVVVPSPRSPSKFPPTPHTVPSFFRNMLLLYPAAIAWTPAIP